MALAMMSNTICSTSSAMGLSQGNLRRDLKLAAEMGLDPDLMLRGGRTLHAIVHETQVTDVVPEYVEVRYPDIRSLFAMDEF